MELQHGSVLLFLVYNFRTLLGVSLLLFSFCLKLRDVSGRGELTSMQWGGGYWNWCDMCLGLGLIAGLSAITAGFALLRCRWLSTDFPDSCVSTSMTTFHPLFLIHSIQEWNQLCWDWIQTGSDEVSQLFPCCQSKTWFSCLQNHRYLGAKSVLQLVLGGKL